MVFEKGFYHCAGGEEFRAKIVCQHRERLFEQGEKLVATSGERVPKHFAPTGEYVAPEVKAEEPSPVTFSAMTDKALEESEHTFQIVEPASDKGALMALTHDQLVSHASDLGLSEGRNLTKMNKTQLSELILSKQNGDLFN